MSNVLLIDDDDDFKKTFAMEAQARGFRTLHKKSFNGLKEVLPSHQNSIFAVVLDIKCLISDDQPAEDPGFIGTALKYLDTFCSNFPRIILTGDDDAYKNFGSFNPEELIFHKTPQGVVDAFAKLKFYSDNSEVLRIRREYSDVFAVLDRPKLNSTSSTTLLHVLSNLDETNFAKYGGLLRDIRSLQEVIYKEINKVDKLIVPDSMFKANGMIKFNDLMRHFNGNPTSPGLPASGTVYQNSAIYNLANSLYWTCGKYIHADPSEKYIISRYTLKSMIFGLMEIILWSGKFLK